MKELISVAQVGRSLGVHLILATQKPSGTVDDNIWSNSKFRLCLRVQDRQDSNDMLHKPDAAYITQAGRCYLQVGNDEVYELFQSGWSGAPYDESLEGGKAEIARLLTINGRTEMTGGHARALRKEQAQRSWIDSLLRCLEELKSSREDTAEELLRRTGGIEETAEAFYSHIEKAGLDYQKSKYNLTRLEDFIRLYAATEGQTEKRADAIIKLAAKTGVRLPEVRERTQLDAVKDYLAETARTNGYQQNHKLWMPVLSGHIYLSEFAGYQETAFADGGWKPLEGGWSLDTPIGMLDDPQNQAQFPLHFSFSEGGHHAVIGSVVSGKSTLIQTVLYGLVTKYTPDYVNIYALDFSSKMMSAFEGLAHFGGIMYEGDDEKIAKFFNMIQRILEERKKLFRGGNYSQYVQVHGVEYPAVIVAIDNFSAFKEKTADVYEKVIIQLSKEGVSHGIFLLLSAGGFGMNEIPNRIAENLKTVLCLELPDKYAYADMLHTTRIPIMPEAGIKGRGLAQSGSRILEYQAALACEAADDYSRMEKISEMCRMMNQAWTGRRARPIPEIPQNPTWQIFAELDETGKAAETDCLVPVGYNSANAEVYSVDLSRIYCYLIAGAARTGKKNFMKVMIEAVRLKGGRIGLIDGGALLNQYAGQEDIAYVSAPEELFAYFRDQLSPEFVRRNQIKKQILARGGEEDELYAVTRKEQPYFLFITDLLWFFSTIYDAKNIKEGAKGFIETLIQKGRWHNIYFVGILNMEDRNSIRGYQAFQHFASYKTGIHFGGNVAQDNFMIFDYMSFKEQAKTEKPGIGQLPEMEGDNTVRRVVVPLVSRKKAKP